MNALDYADFAARTLDVPLTGLNKDGSGPRVFATRTRTGQPFVRAERGKEKFGERMTGRELCTLLPDAHGLVVGDTFIEAGVAAEWRDRASADIAADREAAARRHGTVPATYEPTFDPVADQPKELSTLLYTLAKEGVEFGGVIRFVAGEHQVAGDLPEELVDVAVAARSHFHAPAAGRRCPCTSARATGPETTSSTSTTSPRSTRPGQPRTGWPSCRLTPGPSRSSPTGGCCV